MLSSAALSLSFPQPHEQHAGPLNACVFPPHRTSVVGGDEHSVKAPTPTPQKPDIRKQKAAENSPFSSIFSCADWAVGRKLSENYFPRAWPWYDCTWALRGSSVRLQGTYGFLLDDLFCFVDLGMSLVRFLI